MVEVTIKFEPMTGWNPGTDERVTQVQRFCYEPHFDRHEHGLPNPKYQPHIHVSSTDSTGKPVAVIWENDA